MSGGIERRGSGGGVDVAQNLSQRRGRVGLERLEQRLGHDVYFRPGLLCEAMLNGKGKVGQVCVEEDSVDRALFVDRGWRREDRGRSGARTDGGVGARSGGCLLYTSPSPRDRQKSRMPSSA